MKKHTLISTGLFFCLLFSSINLAKGQDISDFQDVMSLWNLELLIPTENRYKVFDSGRNRFFSYDLRLKSKKDKVELYVIHKLDQGSDIEKFPHLEFTRLLAHLASNDEDHLIYTNFPDITNKNLDFDWRRVADFLPKSQITPYRNGQIKSFYKDGVGQIIVICFYNEKREVPEFLGSL